MVKKKSKFKHISINKKKFYFYEIKWWDILGKDKKHLKTFASYDDNEESFSDRNVFPIGCIKELRKIEI
jgi:hypothetical protein